MRTLGGLFFALLFAAGLSAQYRGGNQSATRITPNVVHPGGGGPRPVGTAPREPWHGIRTTIFMYGYPIYIPMTGPAAYVDPGQADPTQQAAPAQPPPNVIVVYASQPPQDPNTDAVQSSMQVYQPETAPPADETPAVDRYLFAFKDHSIYSALAFWVDGDTLHYFTDGTTHNQVSLSLLDRDLTERLNKEIGTGLKLPAAKN
jgi:hypothetical protein